MEPSRERWRTLLKLLIIAIITALVSSLVSIGIIIGLFVLFQNGIKDNAFGVIVVVPLIFVAGSLVGLASQFIIAILLLRKYRFKRGWLTVLITIVMTLIASTVVSIYAKSIVTTVIANVIIYLVIFVLSGIILNSKLSPLKKTLILIIPGLILVALSILPLGANRFAQSSSTLSLRSQLQQAKLTILVPPPHSSEPQPYDIYPAGENGTVFDSANIGINSGEHDGISLYEYPYDAKEAPASDCSNIPASVSRGYLDDTEQPYCRVATTLSNGTVIYESNALSSPYFVIKSGTIVLVSNKPNSMTVDQLYTFLGTLEPVEIDSFLATLHQQNPQQY